MALRWGAGQFQANRCGDAKTVHGYCQLVVGVDFAKLVIKLSETCAFAKDLAKNDSEFSETRASVEDLAKNVSEFSEKGRPTAYCPDHA